MSQAGFRKRELLAELIARQRGLCALCGGAFREEDPATLDHIRPVADGGGHNGKNLQAAHWTCNNERGSMPIEVWRELHKSTMPRAAPADVIDAPKRKSEDVAMRLGVLSMATRIAFLERANAALHRDWQAATEKLRAIEQIVGGALFGKGGVIEAIKKRMGS